jgi:hypothetical protein
MVWGGVDDEVIAHTDMLDQPYVTKKLAHAAPIGRLGNRLLGCAYFGLTTVALPGGPTLFAHLSWHKPAAPLRDALEDLFGDEARLGWWHEHLRLHIVDRGANGDPVLRWLWSWEVPYLTIGHQGAELWRFLAPTLRSARAPDRGASRSVPGRRGGRRPLGGDRPRPVRGPGRDARDPLPLGSGLHGGGVALAQRAL